MEKKLVAAGLACCLAGGIAHAEPEKKDSVQIYGLLDIGVSYISNQGDDRRFRTDSGIYTPSFIGFKGSEYLSDGTKVIFDLQSQFNIHEGKTIPGHGLFGRTAIVGLDSDRYGRLTLGNQFDFMWDSLTISRNAAGPSAGGLYTFRQGPFAKLGIPFNATGGSDWDRTAGEQVHNSVKYRTPDFGGFTAGALYGFGSGPNRSTKDRTLSFGLNYKSGPFGMGAAYTDVKYGVDATMAPVQTPVRTWGVGMHYEFEKVTAIALFTKTSNRSNNASVYAAEIGGRWQIDPKWALGASYNYMKGNAKLDKNYAHQINSTLSYSLSKRTLVYVQQIYQRTNKDARASINGLFGPDDASSSRNQSISRIGIQTFF